MKLLSGWLARDGVRRKEGFEALKGVGFSFVRLTLDPAIFMASDASRRRTLVDIVTTRLEQILAASGKPKHFEFGSGVRAAQKVYAQHAAMSRQAGA